MCSPGRRLIPAPAIGWCLGAAGLRVVDRVVGLLLAAVAVDLIAAGLRALLPGLD